MTALAGQGEAMDRIYRVQRHFYDATRRHYLLGRDRMIADLAVPSGGTVLEVGCGTARNLIHVARRYPDCRLYGLDISAAMLATAQRNVDRAGLGDRITLAGADATCFDAAALFGTAGFDRVYASYTLSMIPDWRGAIDRAMAAVAPGGRLHIIDFGQQERLPGWFRSALRAWLARFAVSPRADLFNHCLALADAGGLLCETRQPYRGYAWSATLCRPVRPRQDSRRPATN